MCTTCGMPSRRTTGAEVYPHLPALHEKAMLVCLDFPACHTYVGTHESGEPLGTLAGPELRRARMETHAVLDRLWRLGFASRKVIYKRLAAYLGVDEAHIGWADIEECKLIKAWAAESYEDQERKRRGTR